MTAALFRAGIAQKDWVIIKGTYNVGLS